MWCKHPTLLVVVSENWSSCSGEGMSRFALKLKRLKLQLKTLDWNIFGDVFKKFDVLRDSILQGETIFLRMLL